LEKGWAARPGAVFPIRADIPIKRRIANMDPRTLRKLLFFFGAILGGILAMLLWRNFRQLGGWTIAGIFLAVWIAMGVVSVYLLRRQNRRR
jgi:hypothetical protein